MKDQPVRPELSGAAAIVGCYMALREDDILPDEELLMGCWPQVFHLERAFWDSRAQQGLKCIALIVV